MDMQPIRMRETRHGAIMCTDITPDIAVCIKVVFKPKRMDADVEKMVEELKRIYVSSIRTGLSILLQSVEVLKASIGSATKTVKESKKRSKEKKEEDEEE